MSREIAIGVDIGGSCIKGGVIDRSGEVLLSCRTGTDRATSRDGVLGLVIEQIEDMMRRLAAGEGAPDTCLRGLGVCSPGHVDVEHGIVLGGSPNLPQWQDVHLKHALAARFACDVFVDNDANAYGWGEAHFGVGRGERFKTMVCLTLGTGVGGGMIEDGRIKRGRHPLGLEFGHLIVSDRTAAAESRPGWAGMLETFIGSKAIVDRAIALADRYPESVIFKSAEPVTPQAIQQAQRQADPLAEHIYQYVAQYLGLGIMNLLICIDPDLIVLGGGVSQMGENLLDKVLGFILASGLPEPWVRSKIRLSGILPSESFKGAAALALFPSGAPLTTSKNVVKV